MQRLVALDLPGGQGFVDELQRVWSDGDAALPLDQRLPSAAKQALCQRLGAQLVVLPDGERAPLEAGWGVERGDALVVATSGSENSSNDPAWQFWSIARIE